MSGWIRYDINDKDSWPKGNRFRNCLIFRKTKMGNQGRVLMCNWCREQFICLHNGIKLNNADIVFYLLTPKPPETEGEQ